MAGGRLYGDHRLIAAAGQPARRALPSRHRRDPAGAGVRPEAQSGCILCFPPRTDTAVSRARWFRDKGLDALIDALRIVSACRKIAEASGAPWMLENPDLHKSLPTGASRTTPFIRPTTPASNWATNYTKKTCLWTGGGFVMPPPAIDPSLTDVRPDNRIHFASPGEDRANFRSATPMGFARAVFQANAPTHSRIVSR